MARLTPVTIRNAKPGRHPDSGCMGLNLIVRPPAERTGKSARHWMLRAVVASQTGGPGKRRDFGLGPVAELSLEQAREKANRWRAWARAGLDPAAMQAAEDRAKASAAAEAVRTFRSVADLAFDALSPAWNNPKHRKQWTATLEAYAYPVLGDLPVDAISAPDIIRTLQPIWLAKPETARRVRQRIAAVLDFAHANGWRATEAPKRSLEVGKALPRQPRDKRHHAAVPYAKAPEIFAALRTKAPAVSYLALEFAVLTAARSGEVRGAKWTEIDLQAATWTIPAARMKAKREHIVPLTAGAVDVLRRARALHPKAPQASPVFPGKAKALLSDMSLGKAQKALAPGTTVHGWRSTFRDWIAECTAFDGDLAEMALAHTIASKVERAYRRGNMLEKRRLLMDAWESHLTGSGGGKVVALPARKKA